jgi:putative ABC transport system substrate-binding protein
MIMWCSTVGCIVTLTLGLLVVPLAAEAQPPVKVPLIGILGLGPYPSEAQLQRSSFLQGLRELGWHEGQNIAITQRYTEGQRDRLPALAADLVRLKLDVIVTTSTQGVRAATQATTTIPIVSQGAGALVEQGLVASLARPGGNLTGIENAHPGLEGKRLELLKQTAPQISRVALLVNPANPVWNYLLTDRETVAWALGLQLQRVGMTGPGELDAAFAAIVEHHADALFIGDDIIFYHPNLQRQILDFAAVHRLPTLCGVRIFAEAGCLMAYGYSWRELMRRAAVYVDKI